MPTNGQKDGIIKRFGVFIVMDPGMSESRAHMEAGIVKDNKIVFAAEYKTEEEAVNSIEKGSHVLGIPKNHYYFVLPVFKKRANA